MAVFEHTISVILIRIRGDIQSLVYYVSETLSDVETRYMPLEKVELALVHNIKTLSQYFQAYTTIDNGPLLSSNICSQHYWGN